MNVSHPEEVKQHVRAYVIVFVALMALTLITVSVSYLHLGVVASVIIALTIATVKGSLVASYFMHLISEKKLIYATLIFTVFFFLALMFFTFFDGSRRLLL